MFTSIGFRKRLPNHLINNRPKGFNKVQQLSTFNSAAADALLIDCPLGCFVSEETSPLESLQYQPRVPRGSYTIEFEWNLCGIAYIVFEYHGLAGH